MKLAILGIMALLGTAAPLAAQEHEHDRPQPGGQMRMQMPMDEMMGPMMRVMMFNPEHLLQRKDALALTPAQVTRLTALRDAAKTAHDAAETDIKTHHAAVVQAMAGTSPDTTALRQHFQAAHAAMGSAHWAMLRAAAQAKAVLTDVQRGRVEGWADAMEMRHGDDDH